MSNSRRPTIVVAAAFAILLIVMGSRQSTGLFMQPIHESTGISLVAISFALAIGQFVWGLAQSAFGIMADRRGVTPVLLIGAVLLAAGSLLTTVAQSEWMLIVSMGVLTAAGAGAGSFSVLIGATAQRLEPHRRAMASGVINAGGSVGQMTFAPLVQWLISGFGWISAMYALAVSAVLTLPFIRPLAGRPSSEPVTAVEAPRLGAQLRDAAGNRSYWLLNLGFFTCGFHIAFLITHLPGEVGLCGLPASVAATSIAIIGFTNILGSLGSGWLGGRMRMKWLLFGVYFTRAAAIALYIALPRTALNFYLFAAVLGLTWLSTVPPTAGLVGKLFGVRYLATLFGFSMLGHQFGAFFGAWLGGLTRSAFGDYQWMWYADMTLALIAAFVNLPIREAKLAPARAALAPG